ncbi:MAG: galactose mutarotase [Clostridiales Family XIII bacterium]|jgi:aldose 1-epimerase|nr:galactose mutarotase [Clostridiales Family XIII bacterium]
MKIVTEPFGDSSATIIRMMSDRGGELVLTDLGASIVGLKVPARSAVAASDAAKPSPATLVDVALGYGSYSAYMEGGEYLGATIGRYANRIARGELDIHGVTYQLDRNQSVHTLHSGPSGWHKRIWQYMIDEAAGSVTFSLHSPNGDQGFPGNADIDVSYAFVGGSTVAISYHAVSDADTVFNLTNHTYFNLDGEASGSVLGHWIKLNASRFTLTDIDAIPTGEIRSVEGSALDFTAGKLIGEDIDANEQQIEFARGYDHNFVIDGAFEGGVLNREMRHAATVRSEDTGIEMAVRTDLPGVQFYTGNYLGSGPLSKSDAVYQMRSGFCLETQFFPDSLHHAGFPSTLLRRGEPFESVTEYSFRVSAPCRS